MFEHLPSVHIFWKNYFTFSIFREMFEHLPSLHNVCQNPLNCDTASSKMSLWFNICDDDQNVCQLPLNHLNFLSNGFVVSFATGASKTLQVLQMLKPEILKILHLKHSCTQKWYCDHIILPRTTWYISTDDDVSARTCCSEETGKETLCGLRRSCSVGLFPLMKSLMST